MKIRVVGRDGSIETITLVPPIEIRERDYEVPEGVGKLTHITCGDGTDHFFTMDEGYYDGWGRGCSAASLEEAGQQIESFEASREIEPPDGR